MSEATSKTNTLNDFVLKMQKEIQAESQKHKVEIERMSELLKPFNAAVFNESKTLTNNAQKSFVVSMFIGVVFGSKVTLLYSGSVHGFEASKFHSLCDNKGPTLTIIKTTQGHTFGGFTKTSWDSSNSYKHDNSSFLFSVDKLTKYPIIKDYDKAIYCYSSHGVIFGTGHTIRIYDKSN